MRISDWSSDVCSSDLTRFARMPRSCAMPRNSSQACSTASASGGGTRSSSRRWKASRTSSARSTILRLRRSEEHTSELQSLMRISYADFCLKKKKEKSAQQQINEQQITTMNNDISIE